MTSMGVTVVTVGFLFLLLGVSSAHAAGDTAAVTLQVGKEKFALKYVFAVVEPDLLEGGGKEHIAVFLSDKPVPDDLRKASDAWRMWSDGQGREGNLHGVVLVIDPETGAWNRGHLVSPQGMVFYTESVSSPELSHFRFQKTALSTEQIAGKVSMREPMMAGPENDEHWQVAGEFKASVVQRPAITGELTGTTAQNSPQYKAVMAFIAACGKKDFAAIRKTLDPRSQETLDQMVASAGQEEVLNMFSEASAEMKGYQLKKVVVRGDTAEVECTIPGEEPEATATLTVVLVNGEWKYSQ